MQCRASNPLARRIKEWSPKTCLGRPARKTRRTEEILPCAHRADMSLDMFEKSQLVRVRSPPLLVFAPKHVTLSRKILLALLASFLF